MKLHSRRASRIRALLRLFSCVLFTLALAQTPNLYAQPEQKNATTTPERPVTESPGRGAAAAAVTQEPDGATERERRAQAYTKLLEGQRHYTAARTGRITVEALRSAQQAFQKAAELDPTLAEAHTALAEIAFFFLDDMAQAEREAEAAVRINPDNFGAHRVLSRVYTVRSGLSEGKTEQSFVDRAMTSLREIVRLRPNDPEAWALLAEFHLTKGNDREALEALQKWIAAPAALEGRFYQVITKGRELTPDAANARLAEVFMRLGRTSDAIAAIRRAMLIEPENPRYLQMLGEALEAGGADDQSLIPELRSIVAANPKNAAATSMLARAEARAGKIDEAINTLRAAMTGRQNGDRDLLSLQLQLAQTYTDATRYADAIGVYEELLKSRNIGNETLPSERDRRFAASVMVTIINLQRQAGQTEQARASIERMRRLLGSNDPAPDVQNVNLLRSLGQRTEALEAARAARQRHPDDVRLLRLEASTLAELGRVDEALTLLRSRLKGEASDFEEYLVIGSLLMSAGRGNEAVEAARKALQLAPADEPDRATQALVLLSSAQERAGDYKGSEASLRQILAKEPNNATALNNLGYFLIERNERLDEALDLIQRAVRVEPTNASFLDSLGWVYFKLGKLPEAERYLSDAARRNPTSATIHDHLGDLLFGLGRKDQARTAWQKALTLSVEAAEINRIKAKLNDRK